MVASRRTSGQGFMTASQSLQHRAVDVHLAGNRKRKAQAPQHLSAKAYQQSPGVQDGSDGSAAASAKRAKA